MGVIKIGQCVTCSEFFPPEFTILKERKGEKDIFNCYFCERGVNKVDGQHEDGQSFTYTKKECVEDYKKFMRKLKETPGVADALAKNNTRLN